MKINSKYAITAFVVLILTALSMAVVVDDCCEKPDPKVQVLLKSAEHGDLNAIRTLYKQAASDGVAPMVEYWALQGALEGDKEMRMVFVDIFGKIDKNRQEKILIKIQKKSNSPGATCLLYQLKNGTLASGQCNQ